MTINKSELFCSLNFRKKLLCKEFTKNLQRICNEFSLQFQIAIISLMPIIPATLPI